MSDPAMARLNTDFYSFFAELETAMKAIEPRVRPHYAKVLVLFLTMQKLL
jgi:hypothetical protein